MIGGGFVLARLLMRLGLAEQRLERSRRNLERLGKRRFGAGAISAHQKNVAELDGEIRHQRCDVAAATKNLDRLVVALHRHQQRAELAKSQGIRWLAFGGALEPRQRVVVTADLAQRDGELRIDLRIAPAACGSFERYDRVAETALHQQRAAENLQRADVARVGLQHLAGEPLGVGGPIAIQGE